MKRGYVPYNVMRHARWDAAPRDPVTVGNAILVAFQVQTTSVALIYAVGYVATTLVTSWALSALAPKPSLGGMSSAGILVNNRDAAAPQDFVYGQVRKGGTVVYDETTGVNNKYLHRVIALAGHEVEEIGDIYINDEIVTLDGSGVVSSGNYSGKIRIKKHLGDQTTADPDLLSESAQIDTSFIGNGIAYIYARFDYDQDVFANGLPIITAVVKGKKVYDPRTATTAYTNNAALCVRDYLTSTYGLSDSDVDETEFQAAANECDEDVTLSAGGTEKKYTINGIVRADQAHGEVLQLMTTGCAGTLFWGMGAWKLVAGAYTAPVKDFTLDDLRGSISVDPLSNLRDAFNSVQGTFNDAAQDFITVDYPSITSSVFEAEDGGETLPLDLQLPFTTSAATAQRLAKLTLYRSREQIGVEADFSMKAFDVEVGDIITFTNPRYGWSEKEFEVVGWNLTSGEGGDLRVHLSLRETSENAFDWNADETEIIGNNTTLPSPFDVPAVGINATATTLVLREKLTNIVNVVVSSGRAEAVDRVEVEFKPSDNGDYTSIGTGDLGLFRVVDVDTGDYDFRARAINGFGVKGSWEYLLNISANGLLDPPADVSGLTAEVNGATIHLEWEPVADLDLSYYRIRHSVEETGATWANGTTAVDKVPRPASAVSLPTRPGTYHIKAVDKSGVASENYTSIIVPSDNLEGFANSDTQTEDPTFPGTKTGCSVVSSALEITDPSAAPSSATYDFSTYIDTGSVRRVRSRIEANVVRQDNTSGLFDDLPGLFDDLPGLFDDFTGDADFADVNVQAYISTTQDDPAGSPTWSAYQLYRAGEYYGRAFRFRVILTSTSDDITPSVTGLKALVEYN